MRILNYVFVSALGSAVPLVAHAQLDKLEGFVKDIGAGAGLTSELFGGTVGGVTVSALNCATAGSNAACMLSQLLVYAVRQGRLLVAAAAVLIIVVAGFRLIISQSDDALSNAKRTIVGAVTGIFLVFIAEPFIDAIYGGFTLAPARMLSNTREGAMIISSELMGMLKWGETLVASVAVAMLVYQAVIALGSFGAEEQIRRVYKAVLYTVLGILLIVFDRVIVSVFGYNGPGDTLTGPNASKFITELFGLIGFLLGFVALIAVAVIAYAGMLMLVNFGSEDVVNRGKGILLNSAIGLVLIAMSYVIVRTVILGL